MSEKQCRICREGVSAERYSGRLIRPCLCKDSMISYAHIECLIRWRNKSASSSSFFACPQCHYKYRCARTRVSGLAGNKVVIGGLSGLLFTCIVMVASFITTYFMDALEEPSSYSGYFFYVSPFAVAQDLMTAAFRVIRDGQLDEILSQPVVQSPRSNMSSSHYTPPGILRRFIHHFLIGLPLVGAGSIVHVLITLGMLAPAQFIARYRAVRSRRSSSKDVAALIVIALLAAGAIRALFQVYRLTERISRQALLRIEKVILEVN
ncbi:hypothetical protein CPB83DRAFT_801703 [Crepidotus variabilis]|uniref:RING-CH-type domain-containing protein n=1 Tax=Crepidotus variabilis TaxID=179855 RepID=A0A9P6EUB5_9AGAR|nr:hypothetical protein CPB83DRAFT_801703 [Crepidotus variabilis]